jgi:acyl-coenzyme A synthetase/AMP-(fatty) acid ligase
MTLYHRLRALTAADPDAVAMIGPHGVPVSRSELLERAGGARGEGMGEDPVEVLAGQLAAMAAGSTTLTLPTSGSSGRPRVVQRTVASWMASLPAFDVAIGLRGDDVIWAPGAATATMTLYAIWQALAAGVPVLASGSWRGLTDALAEPARTVSMVQCVPVVLDRILDAHAGGVLPRLRTAVVAGAALPVAVRARADRAGLQVIEYYGATELSFVAIDTDGSGLRPFPGVEVDLRDGVLWARSPYLARGSAGPDGWASVGDRADIDPAGVLTITGRGEDAVNVAGHIVLLGDVESVLGAVPGVAELVCLRQADPRLGERLLAVLRAETGADPLPALRAIAAAELSPAARPVRYVVLDELPRTAGGKVARAQLREYLC